MASVVGTTGGATSNGGTTTISLTGLSLLENDTVVVCGGYGHVASADPGPSSSGWEELRAPIIHSANNTIGGVWGKRMGASPDASVVMLGSGTSTVEAAYCVAAFRDASLGEILDAAVATVNGSNPPAVLPINDGAWVIAFVLAQVGVASAAPTGYGNLETRNTGGGTWTCSASIACKEVVTAASENPGTFTWSSGPTTAQSMSIAVRPYIPQPLAPTLSEAHTDTGAQLSTTGFQPNPGDPTDTHQETDWQITTDADTTFATPVVNVSTSTDLLVYVSEALTASTAYRARARHVGEATDGEWSNVVTFTTEVGIPKGNTPTLSEDPGVPKGHDLVSILISAFTHPDGQVEPEDFDLANPESYLEYSEIQVRLSANPNWNTPLETITVPYVDGDLTALFDGLTASTAYKFRGRQFDGYLGVFTLYSADLTVTTNATPANAPLQPTLDSICGRNVILSSSAFAHSATGTHAASEWRICTGGSCKSVVSTTSLLSFTWEDLGPASYTFDVRYKDDQGRWGPRSAAEGCTVPDRPPGPTFTNPPHGEVITANQLVEWEFYDPNVVGWLSDIQYSADGVTFVELYEARVDPFFTFSIPGKPNGDYIIRVRARSPDDDELGDWGYIVLVIDRTGTRAIHYHFADLNELPSTWRQIWTGPSIIDWALRDEFDPVLDSTVRVGLMARNVHSGSTTRNSGLVFDELGEPDEFDIMVTFEHVPNECVWYPYKFANPQVTLGGPMAFGIDGASQVQWSGSATMLEIWSGWYLGSNMACVSDFIQAEALVVSAQWSANHPTNAYRYGRALRTSKIKRVTDRVGTSSLAQATTTVASSTSPRIGGGHMYTDEDAVLGRNRELITIRQRWRRSTSGGSTGWRVQTQVLGAGMAYAEWHRTEFVAEFNSSGRRLACGSCGLAFSDLDQIGVGRSEGILFTDFTLRVESYGSCVAPDTLTGCEADWDFTLMQRDDVTPYYGTADNEGNVAEADFYDRLTCPRPYLKEPKDFSSTEIDFPAGASTIGSIRVGVVDKRMIATDQTSGIVTAIIADVVGHRAVLRRWREDLGMVTVFDGVVESWELDENLVTYWFNLRDPREREREVELFSRNETFALWPNTGPIETYGLISNDVGYLLTPVQPADAISFDRLTPPEGSGGLHYGVINLGNFITSDNANLRDTLLPHATASFDAITNYYRYYDITVRWRLSAGGPWHYLRDMPTLIENSGPAVIEPGVVGVGGQFVQWRLYMGSTESDEIPTDATLIDVQLLAARTTETTPFFWDRGSMGDLVIAIYRGDFSREPPRIRYNLTAFEEWALSTPQYVRFIARTPAKNLREWVQENCFAAIGYAPTFDADMKIIPTKWQLPPEDGTDLVELNVDHFVPVGGYSHGVSTVVNRVKYTIIRESVIPPDGDPPLTGGGNPFLPWVRWDALRQFYADAQWTRLVEEHVTFDFPLAASMRLMGEKLIEYKPATMRSLGTLGEALQALLGQENAERTAQRMGVDILRRYGFGCAEYDAKILSGMAHGPTFDPTTLDLVVGQWVKARVPWLPDYSTGQRNHLRFMQIKGLSDVDVHVRGIKLEDGVPVLLLPGESGGSEPGGSEGGEVEDILSPPTIDYLYVVTATAEYRVAAEIIFPLDAPTGYQARIDYAVSATEPAADSGLWLLASYLLDDGVALTPILFAGAEVWMRARGEATGRRPSAWTTAETITLPDTPGLLAFNVVLDSAGEPTVTWSPNLFAGGVKIETSVDTLGQFPTYSTFGEFHSGDLIVVLTGINVTVTEEIYVLITAYPGYSGGFVTGSPGSEYVVVRNMLE